MWQRHCHAFSGMAALEPINANLDLEREAEQVHGLRVSAGLFSLLGIPPQLGREFVSSEDERGRDHEVILTHELWRSRFHSDPNIVGKSIRLSGYAHNVVGVLPANFYFPRFDQLSGEAFAGWNSPIEYFVPLALAPWEREPAAGNLENFVVIARLKPNIGVAQAAAELDAIGADISRHDRRAAGGVLLRGELAPLKTTVVAAARKILWMLMATTTLVLMIVCVNLGGLLLARTLKRAHEVAVRKALGATHWTLLAQFFIEGLLLVAEGGVLGVLLAWATVRVIIVRAPLSIPRVQSVCIDEHVLVFSVVISLLAGLIFSLLPALGVSRLEPGEALKSTAATTTAARRTSRLRDLLAGSEVALCTVLLITALLLIESLNRVLADNRWLESERVLALDLLVPYNKYGTRDKQRQLEDKLLQRIEELPEVSVAGLTNALPLKGSMWSETLDFEEIHKAEQDEPVANWRFVSPGYFRAIGLPLLRGRVFAAGDEGKKVAVVSQGIAKSIESSRDPLGLHLRWQQDNTSYSVVGVVTDARTDADQQAPLTVYLPYWAQTPTQLSLVIRTGGDARAVAAEVRTTVRQLDNEIAIPHLSTLDDVVSAAVAPRRFVAWLGTVFAAFATLLAAVGLYGILSIAVTQRMNEFGIRLALGAARKNVVCLVIAKGLKVSLTGMIIGLAAALSVSRLFAGVLYGVTASHPAALLIACAVLAGVAGLASYIPAYRATKVDPLVALRYQ